MNSSELIACIGKPEEDPGVQRMLATVGVTKKLKMPKDSIYARVDLPKQGLSLLFRPEGPKSSRLVFSAVQFISDVEKGTTRFAGALPAALVFSDGRAEALGKLGQPFEALPELRRDIWRSQELQTAIKYAKDAPHPIAVITVEVPPND